MQADGRRLVGGARQLRGERRGRRVQRGVRAAAVEEEPAAHEAGERRVGAQRVEEGGGVVGAHQQPALAAAAADVRHGGEDVDAETALKYSATRATCVAAHVTIALARAAVSRLPATSGAGPGSSELRSGSDGHASSKAALAP